MSRLYLTIILILFSFSSFSQQELKQYLQFAQKKYEQGDYVYALKYYQKAMRIDSNSVKILWQYAQTLRAYKNYPKAAYYYGKVYERERTQLYAYSLLYYGLMLKQCGRYEKAIAVFKDAKKKYRRKNPRGYLYQKSREEFKSCVWAKSNVGDSTAVIFEALPKHINTPNAEFGHRVHKNLLYFSSLRADSVDQEEEVYDTAYTTHLYVSAIKNNEFLKDSLLEGVNWEGASTGNGTFSLDGKRFYFSYCKNQSYNYRCKILMAYVEGGKLVEVDTLGDIINTEGANTTMPFIGEWMGKEVLFYASNQEGGKGGMDIWYSFIQDGNQFQRPRNVRRINTMDNELSPFWDKKNNTLYFSSSWYNGFGGYDVFKTHYNTHFLEPINLGEPVNSPANDLYYFKISTGDTAFVSSNRLGSNYSKNPTCCSDIFLMRQKPISLPPSIDETLEDLNKRLPVTLYFHNDIPNPNSWDTTTNVNYIDAYHNYIAMMKQYKKEYAKGLKGDKAMDAKMTIEDFFIQYVKQGVKDLNHFIDLLLPELQRGRKIVLTVKGFASPLAKTDYNVYLAKRRIASVINYLRSYENGIFIPYLEKTSKNGGALMIKEVPFGEYEADQLTSDNPNDKQHSVYSRAAARERKIEIQSADIIRGIDSLTTLLIANQLIYNAGEKQSGTIISQDFTIKNIGQKPIQIDSIIPSSEQVEFSLQQKRLNPGEIATVNITFHTKGFTGFHIAYVIIKYNGLEKGLKLSISTELR